MGTYTEKFNLYKPAVGETGWGTLVSENFQKISELTAEDWGAQPTLTFDTTPTKGSSNPVTSNGIKVEIDKKQDILSGTSGSVVTYTTTAGKLDSTVIDTTPTSGHTSNLVTSAGIRSAIDEKQSTIPKGTKGNVVTYTGVAGSVGELAVNSSPSSGNSGLVTSGGIFTAVNARQSKIPAGTSGNVVTYSGTEGTVGSVSVDDTPTYNSNNLVRSGGVFDLINTKQSKIPKGTSGEVVTYSGTEGTVNSLGFDTVKSGNSKLVKSGDIYNAIETKPTILRGTTEPTTSQGKDGDIYVYYTT